jgi:hypothetical protein
LSLFWEKLGKGAPWHLKQQLLLLLLVSAVRWSLLLLLLTVAGRLYFAAC